MFVLEIIEVHINSEKHFSLTMALNDPANLCRISAVAILHCWKQCADSSLIDSTSTQWILELFKYGEQEEITGRELGQEI